MSVVRTVVFPALRLLVWAVIAAALVVLAFRGGSRDPGGTAGPGAPTLELSSPPVPVGRGKPELRVVGDQRGGPTAARDIAEALWTIAEAWVAGRGRPGIYNLAGAPAVTGAEFAEAVFARAGWPERPRVTPIATADWPTRAVRPAYSVLDCARIAAAYGIGQPDWRPALDSVIDELSEVKA